MQRLTKAIILSLLISGIHHSTINAQVAPTLIEGKGPLVLSLPSNTRSMAMGNAFQLADPTSDIIFYNPSNFVGPTSFEMARQTFGKHSSLLQVSAKTEWWKGGIGLGIQSLTYSKNVNHIHPSAVNHTENALFADGLNRIIESVAVLGYSTNIASVDWGISTKLISQGVGGQKNQTFALDIGGTRKLGDITIGLSHQNLGHGLKMGTSQLNLEDRTTMGAAFHNLPLGPLDIGGSIALSRISDGSITQSLGGEISWWPVVGRTFTGRMGIRNNKEKFNAAIFSFGLAFKGDALGIDYAFNNIDEAGKTHRISVSWR